MVNETEEIQSITTTQEKSMPLFVESGMTGTGLGAITALLSMAFNASTTATTITAVAVGTAVSYAHHYYFRK